MADYEQRVSRLHIDKNLMPENLLNFLTPLWNAYKRCFITLITR